MLHDESSGHDALIEGVVIDAVKNIVLIRMLAYPTSDSAQRTAIEIEFSNVESIAMQADMIRLAANRFAGTVGQWRIARGPGTSYFYLVEGYIAVTSRSEPKLIRK